MLLSKYLILTLLLVCYYGVNYVSANAGLLVPVPKQECSPIETRGCKNRRPCHDGDTENKDVSAIYIKEDYDIGIFQLDAMPTKSDKSTYTLQFFPTDGKDTSVTLLTFNQKSFKESNTTIKVSMPRVIDNKDYKKIKFDDNGYSYGIVELTFDARENQKSNETENRIFYSCARVRLQKKPYKIVGTEIKVDTTLTIVDEESGIGNAVVDQTAKNSTLIIPKMVLHDKEDSGSGSLGNKDPNGDLKTGDDEEHAGNNSNLLNAPFALITLLSLVWALLKL